jgi:hypothetical protein
LKARDIEDQNRCLLRHQQNFRRAADIVADALATFAEVEAVAVIGSVAKALWKEVPRFREFRRAGIEVWHECMDLDLAVWIHSQDRLHALRRASDRALRVAYEQGTGPGTVGHQVEMFLIEPGSDEYLGRICAFGKCPKGKPECYAPGCGAIPFNKQIDGFKPYADWLAGANEAMLYRRGQGRIRSALDLPTPPEEAPRGGRRRTEAAG